MKDHSGQDNGVTIRCTTIKVRIYPTKEQIKIIENTFNCCRFLWNQMLADHDEFYVATGKHFIPNPGTYKRSFPFLKDADSQAFCVVRQNLQNAFQSFFSNPSRFRHPVFKKKKARSYAYTTYCHHYHGRTPDSIRVEGKGIVLPKVKWVKATLHRKPPHWWTLQYAVVSKTKSEKYFCSLVFKYPVKLEKPKPVDEKTSIGLKYSYQHFYVNSDGITADPPQWMRESEKKLKKLQRKMSRMQYGSNNYQKTLQKYRLEMERIKNRRMDFLHKESRRIANVWNAVCVRSDDFTSLSQTVKCVNILDPSFGKFRRLLDYKMRWEGRSFISVETTVPTTMQCHICGSLNETVDRSARSWVCPNCGSMLDREVNAAINIKRAGLAQLLFNDSEVA